jgi:hypothetical protein
MDDKVFYAAYCLFKKGNFKGCLELTAGLLKGQQTKALKDTQYQVTIWSQFIAAATQADARVKDLSWAALSRSQAFATAMRSISAVGKSSNAGCTRLRDYRAFMAFETIGSALAYVDNLYKLHANILTDLGFYVNPNENVNAQAPSIRQGKFALLNKASQSPSQNLGDIGFFNPLWLFFNVEYRTAKKAGDNTYDVKICDICNNYQVLIMGKVTAITAVNKADAGCAATREAYSCVKRTIRGIKVILGGNTTGPVVTLTVAQYTTHSANTTVGHQT